MKYNYATREFRIRWDTPGEPDTEMELPQHVPLFLLLSNGA